MRINLGMSNTFTKTISVKTEEPVNPGMLLSKIGKDQIMVGGTAPMYVASGMKGDNILAATAIGDDCAVQCDISTDSVIIGAPVYMTPAGLASATSENNTATGGVFARAEVMETKLNDLTAEGKPEITVRACWIDFIGGLSPVGTGGGEVFVPTYWTTVDNIAIVIGGVIADFPITDLQTPEVGAIPKINDMVFDGFGRQGIVRNVDLVAGTAQIETIAIPTDNPRQPVINVSDKYPPTPSDINEKQDGDVDLITEDMTANDYYFKTIFINAYFRIESAVLAVPEYARMIGQIIVFLNFSGKVETWQFNAPTVDAYENITQWTKIHEV